MISKKEFVADGIQFRFLSDFIIRSEQFARVYNYVYDVNGIEGDIDPSTGLVIRVLNKPKSEDLVTIDKWDLVDNSISFYIPPQAGTQVYFEVATTAEEFGDTLIQPAVERAETAADAAEASEIAAAASEAAAALSEAAAALSETNAAASEAAALASQNAAALSETNAASSEAAAALSEAAAGLSEAAAALSETNAAASETAAAASAAAALVSETNAAAWAATIDPSTYVSQTSETGAAELPTGTIAQRDVIPTTGMLRFNSDDSVFEGYYGAYWGSVGGGATGAGTDDIFYENSQNVTQDYTITAGKNAVSAGPITIDNGVTVTVPDGSVWTIV